MGARGGAIRVRAWKCPTCRELFEQSDGGREAAVRCCNEKMAEAEQKREEARARRAFAGVRKPRAHFERDSFRTIAVATAKCPKCPASRTVRVRVGDRGWRGTLTKEDAAKKAAALAVAGIGKHLRSRWSH